jgi:hypothetical protein
MVRKCPGPRDGRFPCCVAVSDGRHISPGHVRFPRSCFSLMRFSVGFSFAVRGLRYIVWFRERLMPSSDSAIPTKRARLRTRDVLFLLLVAAGFVFFSAPQLFSPWVYFIGGSFHPMPWWSGAGSFTAPDGNYQLYLYLEPLHTGASRTIHTALTGKGHLCTPSGERLALQVQGDMDKHLPQDTIGRWIEISSYVRSSPGTFSAYTPPGSLRVKLTGSWGIGKIEAKGILDHQPAVPGQVAPPKPAPIAVTLHQSGMSWPPACPVL